MGDGSGSKAMLSPIEEKTWHPAFPKRPFDFIGALPSTDNMVDGVPPRRTRWVDVMEALRCGPRRA
jgi:hypothetical protein